MRNVLFPNIYKIYFLFFPTTRLCKVMYSLIKNFSQKNWFTNVTYFAVVAKTTITTKELRWFCNLEMCWNTTRVMIQIKFVMLCLTVLGNILFVIMDPKCHWPSPELPTITLYLSGYKTKLCTLVIQILRTADILFFKFRWMTIILY